MIVGQRFMWESIGKIPSKSYTCGYCGNPLASENGWRGSTIYHAYAYIYVCHHCSHPTFFDHLGAQVPGALYGNTVDHISDKAVNDLYEEARKCTGSSASTATVLCCRKLLMHIAADKGADKGKSFTYYVDYLAEKNFVPPGARDWVDHIREKGNEANHEITIMSSDDAKELLSFIEMLLKIIYEFPATAQKKYGKAAGNKNSV